MRTITYKDLSLSPMGGGYWVVKKGKNLLAAWLTKVEVRSLVKNRERDQE